MHRFECDILGEFFAQSQVAFFCKPTAVDRRLSDTFLGSFSLCRLFFVKFQNHPPVSQSQTISPLPEPFFFCLALGPLKQTWGYSILKKLWKIYKLNWIEQKRSVKSRAHNKRTLCGCYCAWKSFKKEKFLIKIAN